MDFSEWTGTQWVAAGVITTAALTVLGWLGVAVRRRLDRVKEVLPHITFSHVYFRGPGSHPRPRPFAIYLEVFNHGPGTAAPVWVAFHDPLDQVLCETTRIPSIAAYEPTSDFLGFFLRGWEDADEQQSRALFQRGQLSALCWDVDGRQYEFTPQGRRRLWRGITEAQMMAAVRDGYARIADDHLAAGLGGLPASAPSRRRFLIYGAVAAVLIGAAIYFYLK